MGEVFLAHDSRLNRSVALKICLHARSHPQTLERFRREAQAAAGLRHPNLCPVYETDVRDGIPYLTMAYIEGPTLGQWLAQRAALTPREAVLLVRKLALAMKEAHDNGVIHRDLKPANVVIDKKGEPVILDFGLAKRTDGGANLTKLGAVLGTPSYMAPEQVLGETKVIGPPCDVYALGVILYELLTGRVPFEGSQMVVLGRIVGAAPQSPRELRPDLDPRLEAICLKALEKKPADRYASMAEFAAVLTDYARTAPNTPTMVPPASATHAAMSASFNSTELSLEGVTAIPPPPPLPELAPVKHPPRKPKTLPPPVPETTLQADHGRSRRTLLIVLLLGLMLLIGGSVVVLVKYAGRSEPAKPPVEDNARDKNPKEGTPTDNPLLMGRPEAPHPFVNSLGMKLVHVRAGIFLMGSPDDEANHLDAELRHKVKLTRGFYMGSTLVTQGQWRAIMGDNPSHFHGDEATLPVESVTWDQCREFCERLSRRESANTVCRARRNGSTLAARGRKRRSGAGRRSRRTRRITTAVTSTVPAWSV